MEFGVKYLKTPSEAAEQRPSNRHKSGETTVAEESDTGAR